MRIEPPERVAELYLHYADREDERLCLMPCEADVPDGSSLRVVIAGDGLHDFIVTDSAGMRLDVVVAAKHTGGYYRGAVALLLGGVVLGVGGAFLIALQGIGGGGGGSMNQSGLAIGGGLAIASGAVMAVTGLLMAADHGYASTQRGEWRAPAARQPTAWPAVDDAQRAGAEAALVAPGVVVPAGFRIAF